jgi:TolB-like protein
MATKKNGGIGLLLGVLLVLPTAGTLAAPSAAKTVLITPFRFYAPADVAFLNPGILEMLTTRLLRVGSLSVKEWTKSPVDPAEAMVLAQKQQADFILVGGITIFDDRVSTDARLLDARDGQPVLLFSRFGRRPGDVLEHVDLLAAEMAEFFGAKGGP